MRMLVGDAVLEAFQILLRVLNAVAIVVVVVMHGRQVVSEFLRTSLCWSSGGGSARTRQKASEPLEGPRHDQADRLSPFGHTLQDIANSTLR